MQRSMLRTFFVALGALALMLTVAACGSGGSGDSGESGGNQGNITVGSKNFTEQLILGELYAQTLEANGFSVEKNLNLGSVEIADQALQSGEIDMYPEYTGTSLETVLEFQNAGQLEFSRSNLR